MTIFDWSYAWEILPQLLLASVKTLQITVLGFCIAVVVGFLLTLARRSSIRALAWSASLFVEFMRSTPLLIQIYFIFFVFPSFSINLSAMQAGLIGIGLHYACYLSEVYRGGLESVPKGQWEAVTALNMKASTAYRRIIIPQALKPILPPMGNYLIAMLKETPVLSAITVVEIMLKAKNLGSESFRFLEPITLVGVFFLIISIALSYAVRKVEYRLERQK
ncbi:ectoine/hydroxyectoine ABC transporter permease subunit EhuD [Pseudomonas sp. NPDC089569]|uniref:ectoine/hydroxyectoine ABC transporter permease subunit EhuD n=1 Tax=Pseudomonas sp. NPDC089569 TaxID=3390722 RepID=UPI003D07EB95